MLPVLYFDAATLGDLKHDVSQDSAARQDKGKYMCCVQCRHRIAPLSSAVEINGSQVHRRRNPLGHYFVFQCYRAAPGCAVSGEPTAEYSWFAGYRWQFASCNQCQNQLGWYFSGENGFFGLIRDQLIVCEESGGKQNN